MTYFVALVNKILLKPVKLSYSKVKQSEIFLISLLISLLQNSTRILEYAGLISFSIAPDAQASSFVDVSFRTSFLFLFSWLVLQFNTNFDGYFKKYGKLAFIAVSVFVNGFILLVFTRFYYDLYDNITGRDLYVRDQRLLLFILVILMFGLIVLAKNLRYKIRRQADLEEKERLVKQNLQNELSALKNQINPHFLFNSLNSLNSLIRDNKEATNFVNQLSFMYRYILQSGQRDLVSVKEELKFIESYIFLIKTRYRDKFSIEINVAPEYLSLQMPVLALQLLVENAVKHNEISNRNPLNVKIFTTNGNLVVENKIKPRSTFVDSTGQGLANINKRYQLLKEKSIQISNENNIFRVKLPIK